MPRTWSAVLARMGVPTGDGRILDPAGAASRDLPLPLLWQTESGEGHDGSMIVGRIETLRFQDGMVMATGSMLDSANYTLVIEQLEAGVVGPSVDLDDIDYVMDEAERIVLTRWRVAGATLVAIPAFAEVSLTLDPEPAYITEVVEAAGGDFLMASVRTSGWSDMPIADEGRAWDGDAAAGRVASWAGVDAGDAPASAWSKYARAFLRKDDDADPQTRGAYGFGIADVIDGTLTIVPRGVFAAAAAVQGARTGSTPEDAEGMKRVLRGIYDRLDREAPFSLAASAAPVLPPSTWFAKPDVDRLTPLTIAPEGRVFGHIAPWGQCHVGLPGCVTAPSSGSGYSYFHVSEQQTSDGLLLPVGTLVAGPRHADPKLAFQAAAAHYDDPSAAVARVVAGEDDHGIWVAGWVLPTAQPGAVEVFKSSPVSGDWRRVAGSLELIAVCSVNTPGFPVPRARVSFGLGRQRTLIGAFGITPVEATNEQIAARDAEAGRVARPITAEEAREHFSPWLAADEGTATVDTTAADTARARWAWAQTEVE